MRPLASFLVLATTLSLFADVQPPTQPSSVTIPLDVYSELQKSKENASATVVDTMTVGGTFRDKTLSVTFAGRSVGARVATPVVTDATDLTLSGCSGDALIERAGRGAYSIVALAPSFSLKCDARLSGSDRLQMNVQPSVLAVRSAVNDGELVAAEENGDGARTYTLVRQVVGVNETLAATATGRYLITLLPDATRFRYTIQVHNPNRNTAPLPLRLVSSEHLQQIDSSAPYEMKDGSYVFAMPPGDATITLSGELRGTSFAPPVEASLQYVVIESHPLLRPAVQAAPKRISAGETGIDTEYRGALAFEIGAKQRISWSVTRLEALRAISYAVHAATHTLFIPANGPILGESQFNIDNQGAPELVLQPKPEPTYVSLQNETVLMTKNPAGELTIPLSNGEQNVVVQHRQRVPHFGVVMAKLDVPQVPIPATTSRLTLRYPDHWLPLWQSFATEAMVWHPKAETMIVFLALALWLERALAFLTIALRRRVAIALMLSFAAGLVPVVMWLVVLSCLFVTIVWLTRIRSWSPSLLVAIAALGLLVVIMINGAATTFRRSKSSSDSFQRAETANTANFTAEQKSLGYLGYQGLPAKFELPEGARSETFTQQMVATDKPQRVTILLLSMTFVTWVAGAFALVAAWRLWRERAAIREALRARISAVMEEAPATA